MESTSTSLLHRLRQPSDQAAWDQFVEIYTPVLYYWCRRVGLSRDDAADLVQDVFIVLVEKLPDFSYDPQRTFRGWLRTVLLNKWRQQQRRRGRVVCVGASVDRPESSADALELLWEADYRRAVINRLARQVQGDFQPKTWTAFWETAVNGRPPSEIAHELGISVGGVYIAKSKVLCRLREVAEGLLD